jgi:integrase/recombinase XerD
MTELRCHLRDYTALRRSLGFAAKEADFLLPSFLTYLEERHATNVTTELALAWASSPEGVLAVTRRQRLSAVRGFARHLSNLDEATEIPPLDLLPASYSRVTPYLYSDEEIEALMAAARSLSPGLRALTYETVIGLLAVSGIRIGEAIRLGRDDVDVVRSLLVVRDSKVERSREVPLHETTLAALDTYRRARDRRFSAPAPASFFVSTLGTPLHPCTVNKTHRDLVALAGLQGRGGRCRPRLHDLRHSFAVNTIIGWHRDGLDVDARMPLLSKVLGHADPKSTYWYLQAAPELLALVAGRLEPVFGELP